ncbi:hypothetical protein ISP15_14635 [Dyella jejuensis]|uniref:Serine/threonine protein kinase n=1 Tax=Dyella jejuensis TaxID=1432009 RepID=A0ABW8JKC5_9GAMM
MELDDMKQAWQKLGHRVEQQGSLERQILRDMQLGRLRSRFRPLVSGQLALIALGVALALWGGHFWFMHLHIWQAVACGMAMQVFGILSIIFPARVLVFVYGLDYAAPVVEIQRRIARLRMWRVKVEAPVFGVLGTVIWIPALLMLAQYEMDRSGINLWHSLPGSLFWLGLDGVMSLAAVVIVYGALIKLGWRRRLEDSFAGKSVKRAEAALLEIVQFERE